MNWLIWVVAGLWFLALGILLSISPDAGDGSTDWQ